MGGRAIGLVFVVVDRAEVARLVLQVAQRRIERGGLGESQWGKKGGGRGGQDHEDSRFHTQWNFKRGAIQRSTKPRACARWILGNCADLIQSSGTPLKNGIVLSGG